MKSIHILLSYQKNNKNLVNISEIDGNKYYIVNILYSRNEKLEKRDKYIDFLHKSVYTKYTIN